MMRCMKWAFLPVLLFLSGLAFSQPTQLLADRLAYADFVIQALSFSHDPNEERLFVVQQGGRVMVYDEGLLETPFLDLGTQPQGVVDFGIGSEEGLLSMALDPNYDQNGFFYLVYNGYLPDGSGVGAYDWNLVRFRRSFDNPYVADPDWFEVILTIQETRRGHNGGAMFFGQDGYLYVSTGDGGSTGSGATGGGSGGDADNNAQNLGVLFGKVLRLDVSGDAPYAIPADNPFVGVEGARGEIWSYGWRNPWRWSFDRQTGDMYIGDVGELDWEEISFNPAGVGGLNFGWRLLEGPMCYEPVNECDPDNLTELPIHAYQHDGSVCSVIGGFMYRGDAIPTLRGHYIYSDACGFGDEKFWLLTPSSNGYSNQPVEVIVEGGFVPWDETRFGFGQNNKGELFICTRLALYKIFSDPNAEDVPPASAFDIRLFPNPGNVFVNLDLGGDYLLEEIQFYGNDGRLVDLKSPVTGGVRYYNFSVENLANGHYFVAVKLLGRDELFVRRLFVVHTND